MSILSKCLKCSRKHSLQYSFALRDILYFIYSDKQCMHMHMLQGVASGSIPGLKSTMLSALFFYDKARFNKSIVKKQFHFSYCLLSILLSV